jgi:uncharacterized membrane protein YhaH (DUF805 family)
MTKPKIGMAFVEAVTTKYATFSGRARRSEYGCIILGFVGLFVVAIVTDRSSGARLVASLLVVGLLLPAIAVTVRRLHDTGCSGWRMLIYLVLPLVGLVALISLMFIDGQRGDNAYGPNPKGQRGGPGPGATA